MNTLTEYSLLHKDADLELSKWSVGGEEWWSHIEDEQAPGQVLAGSYQAEL